MPENESSDLDWLSMAGKSFRNPLLFRLPTNGQMVDWLKVWFVYLAQRMSGILDLFFFLNFSSSSLFRLLLFCPDSYFSQSERIQCYTKARKKRDTQKEMKFFPEFSKPPIRLMTSAGFFVMQKASAFFVFWPAHSF